ncbi:MAG: heavy-metal-associated domain-containing protein [Bacteroidia bacterium]|nr:heavy-metal-associated domain-containing protein [Bacteroidia bacterium]
MIKTLKVEGMSCKHCVMHVKEALLAVEGVNDVSIDLAKGQVLVKTKTAVDDASLKSAVEEAGYTVINII